MTATAAHTRFTSTAGLEPRERGREFGVVWGERVAATVQRYRPLFARAGHGSLDGPGAAALDRIRRWSPDLAEEVTGIAEGAALPVNAVAAINARTELLAGHGTAGECSTVAVLPSAGATPLAAQNWDWYAGFADGWLEWEIPFEAGRRTTTLTEFGIVGKIGVNDRGVACLFNILHHRADGMGAGIGDPVHAVARRVLDEADDAVQAMAIIGAARTSASTTITVVGDSAPARTAASCELRPGGLGHVLPDADGLLVHTNHFLTRPGADGDTEPVTDPDTLVRYDALRRALRGDTDAMRDADLLAALSDHTGGVCVHAPGGAPDAFQTLATVAVDFRARALRIHPGPPCGGAAF